MRSAKTAPTSASNSPPRPWARPAGPFAPGPSGPAPGIWRRKRPLFGIWRRRRQPVGIWRRKRQSIGILRHSRPILHKFPLSLHRKLGETGRRGVFSSDRGPRCHKVPDMHSREGAMAASGGPPRGSHLSISNKTCQNHPTRPGTETFLPIRRHTYLFIRAPCPRDHTYLALNGTGRAIAPSSRPRCAGSPVQGNPLQRYAPLGGQLRRRSDQAAHSRTRHQGLAVVSGAKPRPPRRRSRRPGVGSNFIDKRSLEPGCLEPGHGRGPLPAEPGCGERVPRLAEEAFGRKRRRRSIWGQTAAPGSGLRHFSSHDSFGTATNSANEQRLAWDCRLRREIALPPRPAFAGDIELKLAPNPDDFESAIAIDCGLSQHARLGRNLHLLYCFVSVSFRRPHLFFRSVCDAISDGASYHDV